MVIQLTCVLCKFNATYVRGGGYIKVYIAFENDSTELYLECADCIFESRLILEVFCQIHER